MKRLAVDKDFSPCPEADDDELFPNGIFVFNITKMLEWIRDNLDNVTLDEVAVDDFSWGSSSLDETHLDTLELDRPVILAEIAPGRYNVIDGNHRMEKARRMSVASLPAYRAESGAAHEIPDEPRRVRGLRQILE